MQIDHRDTIQRLATKLGAAHAYIAELETIVATFQAQAEAKSTESAESTSKES